MGQTQSVEDHRSHEEIAAELAEKFARKCFEPLELYSFKDNFRSLADVEQNVRYLKEDTIARFLELPDILGVSPIMFQMMSYIGAFPFLSNAPAVLGFEQMIVVVAIMTRRYKKVLADAVTSRRKLLFKSLAVYDRKISEIHDEPASVTQPASDATQVRSHAPGFTVDEAGDDEDEDAADDELVLAALDSLDVDDVFKTGDAHSRTTLGALIPSDNFRKLVMLLLLIAPLDATEHLSAYADRVTGPELESLRSTAENILTSFVDVETSPGINWARFNRVMPILFPNLFAGFNSLFEHFLFSKNLDFSKHKNGDAKPLPPVLKPPLVQDEGRILNVNVLSQLSFFILGDELYRRLRLLYSGADAGFSMGSFETKVFNWRAPTILLVSGTRLNSSSTHGAEAHFTDTLPPKRFPNGNSSDEDQVVFGALIREPWRQSHKDCFGGGDMVLFQLAPTHDVFPASTINHDYVAFSKSPSTFPGITIGCPPPKAANSSRHSTLRALGPVSLVIDGSFEFGVFTHDYTSRGGAFATSVSRRYDFQERFEIDDIEVWGCGGDAEAKIQRERWEWEAREAEARRKINLGAGDRDTDRALLEMAGIIGGNRSGGSMM